MSDCAPSKMCQHRLGHMNFLQTQNRSHQVFARSIENVAVGLSTAGDAAVDFRCCLMVCLALASVKAHGPPIHSKGFP